MTALVANSVQQPRLARMKAGAWLGGYLTAALLLGALPSRLAMAQHESQHAGSVFGLAVAGIAADVPYTVLFSVMLSLLLLGCVWLRTCRRRREPSPGVLRGVVIASAWLLFVTMVVLLIAATEFRIERGLYPTFLDTSAAFGDDGYLAEALHTFLLDRYRWAWAGCGLVLAAASLRIAKTGGFEAMWSRHGMAGFFGVQLVAIGLGAGVYHVSPLVMDSLDHRKVVRSPLPVFFASLGSVDSNVQYGFVGLIEHIELPSSSRRAGAAQLGYSPATPERIEQARAQNRCHPHPFASAITPVPGPDASPLERALASLSQALFADRSEPLRVWHVLLESFRGDDIHALNPAAPMAVTPFTNGLYALARDKAPRVFAAGRMYQAGGRTSHALAAITCGLGTMPFNMSFARDLGKQPMRCLPDVLSDASFELNFYYGSRVSFDNMGVFLRYHGFERLFTEKDFRESAPRRGWGVPDHDVFVQSLADANSRSGSQYNLMFSLTNHHPFRLPIGHDHEHMAELDRAIRDAGHVLGADDRARVQTMRYTDDALAQLVEAFESSAAASQGFMVVQADHATGDFFLWRKGRKLEKLEARLGLSHIPFVIVFPEALVKTARDPARVREIIRQLNAAWQKQPLSENDVPRMLLSLLSATRQLRSIAPAWKWHSIGGQRMSPDYAFAPGVSVIGIHASSHTFGVLADGSFHSLDDAAWPIRTPERAMQSTPSLHPSAALLSSFMIDYARRCRGPHNIRASARKPQR
jgi:hypothetical protein